MPWPWPTPFSTLLGRQWDLTKLKDDSKNVNGQINLSCLSVISSVNFHGKFALKLEMTEFYESLLHSFRANKQSSDATFTNVKLFSHFSFDTRMAEVPCQTDI